jgi:hypothetical protein
MRDVKSNKRWKAAAEETERWLHDSGHPHDLGRNRRSNGRNFSTSISVGGFSNNIRDGVGISE